MSGRQVSYGPWRARVRRSVVMVAVLVLVMGVLGRRLIGQAGSPPIELVSVTAGGQPGGGQTFIDGIPYDYGPSHISADNRYVVFSSLSPSLVAGDTNAMQDIFVRDRQVGTTTLVSRAADGGLSNGHSGTPVISASGRYVAFVSAATNLVPGDTNAWNDVFVRDLQTGTTVRADVTSGGAQANFGASDPAISADGRYVVFTSGADMLVPGGEPNVFNVDVFRRDLVAGITERVSVRPDGSPIIGADSLSPTISADGQRVAFGVYNNSLAGPTPGAAPNLHHGIYVRDFAAGTMVLASIRPDGSPAELLYSLDPMISANGRYVSFTNWEDLDPAFPDQDDEFDGPYSDIFVRDLQTTAVSRVSLPFPGGPAEESGNRATISANGRYVTYISNDSGLRIRDRVAGTTTNVTAPGGAAPDGFFDSPSISEDGQLIWFESYATNLVPGDSNGIPDTFLFHLAPSADLSLSLTASTVQPSPGSTVTLTIGVTNGGPSEATGVAVRALLPTGLTFVSSSGPGSYASGSGVWSVETLAAGSTATLQIVATFSATAPVAMIAQVSAASPGDPDSTPDNSVAGEDDQRTVTLTPAIADLSLTASANTTTPVVNSNVTFTTVVTNAGPGSATGVAVRVDLPAALTFVSATPGGAYNAATGRWTLTAIANGGTQTLQLVARVTSAAPMDVVAQVSAANELDPDSTPDNDVAGEDDDSRIHLVPTASTGIIVNDATPVVNPTDGKCTLVEAIIAANTDAPSGSALGECAGGSGADVIRLRALTPPYTYTAAHNFVSGANALPVITSDITIDGAGAAIERSSAPGTPAFRIFMVGAPGRLTLDHVTVRNGRATAAGDGAYGGGLFNVGVLTIDGSTISGNAAACDGGGLISTGPLVVRNGAQILGNTAGCSGGGIGTFFAGSVTIADTLIMLNAASNGGGGVFVHGTTTAAMTNTRVEANSATVEGGGIFTHNADANLAIADSQIVNNTVTAGSGGGIANGRINLVTGVPLIPGGTMTLTTVTVTGNRATGGYGGGIASAGPLALITSSVSDNQMMTGAFCGGGIYNAAALQLTGTLVTRNASGFGSGAGICSIGLGPLAVSGSTISQNTSTGVGGGVALFFSPGATFTDSAVASNTGGSGGGGIYSLAGSVTATLVLDNTLLQQNLTNGHGGGLYTQGGTITARNNTRVVSNVATGAGGGVALIQAGAGAATVFTMTGGLIDGNTANGDWSVYGGGGGLAAFDQSPATAVTLTGVTVTNNHAPIGDGGGIFNRGLLTMTGGTIGANTALSGGGLANGTFVMTGGFANLMNVVIEGNVVTSLGGGIFGGNPPAPAAPSAIVVSGGAIRNNQAPSGAGAFIRANAILHVTGGSVVSGNVATGGGGGATNEGTLRLTDITVSGNAAFVGGAVLSNGATTIAGTTITGNTATTGAGLRINSALTDILNSTISGNAASATGVGAVDIANLGGGLSGRANITATTIVDNTGSVGGITNGGYLQLANAILVGNRRADGTPAECVVLAGAAGTATGSNLIGQDAGCLLFAAAPPGAFDRFVDPALLFSAVVFPLADNGGPTRTHALRPGSLAIDGGRPSVPCPAMDQRGTPRPADGDGDGAAGCDIGAYEQATPLAGPAPVLTSLNPASVPTGTLPVTLTIAGTGFVSGSVASFNGAPRATFAVSSTQLRVTLTAADVNLAADLTTASIVVANPGPVVSNALALTIVSARVGPVVGRVIVPGTSGSASTAPAVAGQSGVSATLTNNTASSTPATLTVANYVAAPVGGTTFAAGGMFDVQVTGADPTDTLAVRYYYPSTVSAATELTLQLQYWTGAAWAPVRSSGGAAPAKDTTNNLDGTVSGGRFSLTFDNSSTPRITDLGGTVFAIAAAAPAGPPVTVAQESPAANAAGWHNTNVTVALTATASGSTIARTEYNLDDRGWKSYAAPIPVTAEGVHTLRYRSVDAAGRTETARTLTVRIDKTAPVLALRADPLLIWPANGKLRTVEIDVTVKDGGSGADGFVLRSVDSNAREGDPTDIVGWAIGTADTKGQVRAEFTRIGRPRLYTITYEATDRAGNRTVCSEVIWVVQIGGHPDDRRH